MYIQKRRCNIASQEEVIRAQTETIHAVNEENRMLLDAIKEICAALQIEAKQLEEPGDE